MATLATQIRLEKVAQRQLKYSYKNLSPDQKKIVKLRERKDQNIKDLDRFWRTAPRDENGAVAWGEISDIEMDCFNRINKALELINKSLSKYTDEQIDEALNFFKQTNIHSTSY